MFHQKPVYMNISNNFAHSLSILKILYEHNFKSFQHHLIDFHLFWTKLNNLNVWFAKLSLSQKFYKHQPNNMPKFILGQNFYWGFETKNILKIRY